MMMRRLYTIFSSLALASKFEHKEKLFSFENTQSPHSRKRDTLCEEIVKMHLNVAHSKTNDNLVFYFFDDFKATHHQVFMR